MRLQPLPVRLRRLREEAMCARRQVDRLVKAIAAIQKALEQEHGKSKTRESL